MHRLNRLQSKRVAVPHLSGLATLYFLNQPGVTSLMHIFYRDNYLFATDIYKKDYVF